MTTGIRPQDLLQYVIRPTLQALGLHSKAAEQLVLGTAAQESHLGHYLHQVRGPALGIYQMEPATHRDIWDNFLKYKPDMSQRIMAIAAPWEHDLERQLVVNLAYATALCRIHYLRVQDPLPQADNTYSLGRYWKDHYNTRLGRGTVEEFQRNYDRLIGDLNV